MGSLLAAPTTTTFASLIDSALPPLQGESPNKSTTSRPSEPDRVPKDVRHWATLERNVIKARSAIDNMLLRSHIPPLNCPQGGSYRARDEARIQAYFLLSAGEALHSLFNNKVVVDTPLNQGNSRPDFTAEQNSIIYVVGEVKCTFINRVGAGDSLVRLYNTKGYKDITSLVHQTVGYMISYSVKYAFMSSYQFTWARKLTATGLLHVSSPWMSETKGNLSVLNMMYFVISLAKKERDQAGVGWTKPAAHVKNPFTDDNDEEEKKPHRKRKSAASVRNTEEEEDSEEDDKKLTSKPTPSKRSKKRAVTGVELSPWQLKLYGVTKENEYGALWKAEYAKRIVAVKAFKHQRDRDRELHVYELLQKVQGSLVPVLLGTVDLGERDRKAPHGLVLSWMGPVQPSPRASLTLETAELLAVVKRLHRLGVSHGDLHRQNIIRGGDGALNVVDFGEASIRGQQQFEQSKEEDLLSVQELVAHG